MLAATDAAHRATIAWVTTPIGRTPVALARRLGARRRHAAHRLHARDDASRGRERSRVDGGLLARRRASTRAPITAARLAGALSVRQHAARRAHHRRAAARLPRAERALLHHVGDAARRRRSDDSRLQLRHRLRRGLHASTCRAGRASASRGSRCAAGRCADRQLHDGAEQLSPDGRRRLRHAARRAGRLRQAAGDPPAARSTKCGVAARSRPSRLLHAELAHRAGAGGGARSTRDAAATIARTRTRSAPAALARRPPRRAAPSRRRRCASSARTTSTARSSRGPTPAACGAAAPAYLASGARAAPRRAASPPACETILLDGGDEFQGTPASNLAFGRPVVAIFNAARLRRRRPGQPRVRLGAGHAARAHARGALRASSARTCAYTDGRDVPWIRDDTLVTRGALTIGVIGVATVVDAERPRARPTWRTCASSSPRRSSTASRAACARAAPTT